METLWNNSANRQKRTVTVSPKLQIIWSTIRTEASDVNPIVRYNYAKYLREIQRKQLDTRTAQWTSPSSPALRRMFVSRKRCFASNSFATEIRPGPHEIHGHSAPFGPKNLSFKHQRLERSWILTSFYTSVIQPGFMNLKDPKHKALC